VDSPSHKLLPKVAGLTALSNVVFVGVVSAVAWLALDSIEQEVRVDTGQALETLVETSHGSVVVWARRHRTQVDEMAQDDLVLELTQQLLNLPRDRQVLLSSPAMAELRDLFQSSAARHEHEGFFIIATDGTSIASMRDANVATDNLIFTQRPDVFARALAGESVLVPPVRSDVPLVGTDGLRHANAPTMFVAAPIVTENGSVIAILTQRLDPFRDFSRLMEIARVGDSGETYAFDSEGRLLSNVRFGNDLHRVGLLQHGQAPILALRIADPGGDLLQGYEPPPGTERWPLTMAAEDALQRRGGRDVRGYRDYRGVPVIGAWLWSHELGIGLASEIDVEDALTSYYSTRRWVLGLVGVTAALAIFLTWLVFWVRSRGIRALADRENRMRSILDTAADGIITIDEHGSIETFNPAAEAMFGYRREEVVGQNISILAPEAYASRHRDYVARFLTNGDARALGAGRELLGRRKDGTLFPVELGVAEIPAGKGRGPRFTGVIRDITERKSLEAQFLQSQKMEAVGHLAAGVAHDFNNLLMGVSGSARVALNRIDDQARVRDLLEDIHASSVAGAAITRQLLALTRAKDSEPVELELDETVGRSRGILERLIGEDIELQMELGAPSAWLACGEGHLEQILINLAVNARDAMPRGGQLVISTGVRTIGVDELITLTVEDTGVGMTEETLQHVFEPFFTTKDVGKGTGLGLSTVYGIVSQGRGTIEVSSEPGVGTSFTILLPRAPTPTSQPSSQPARLTPLAPMTVLVVEDEELVRKSVCHFLRAGGHRVLSAIGLEEARAACEADDRPIDVLITDVVLRGEPGSAVAKVVRGLRPGIGVLFMSAHAPEYLWKSGRLEPGTPTIQKPFDQAELYRQLRDLIRRQGRGEPAESEPVTVLLVEDDPLSRDSTAELLEDEGFHVRAAKTGDEAQRIYEEAKGQVILVTDFGLPDIPGQELVERLAALFPVERVIYISGRSEDDPTVKEALARPEASFLQKPIDFDELARELRRTG